MTPGKLYRCKTDVSFDKHKGRLLLGEVRILLPENHIILFLGCDEINFGNSVTISVLFKNRILIRYTVFEIFETWFEEVTI